MIQSSGHMKAKQSLLAGALPPLVGTMVNPPCVKTADDVKSPSGPFDPCPDGYHRVFPPMMDLHVGIISSSLGSHGADTCNPATQPEADDRGHLLTRGAGGPGALPTYQGLGFLAWDPEQKLAPPGEADIDGPDTGADPDKTSLIPALRDLVSGVGQSGCGFESQLESWYRFLVEPDPHASISIDADEDAILTGTDSDLLAQRKAFLRPDSLVGVVMLGDQDDCSVIDGGQFYQVLKAKGANDATFRLPRGRAICETKPGDPCCVSCAQATPAGCDEDPTCTAPNGGVALQDDDAFPLRCFDQKRRFGIDFLQPVSRYVDGLTNVKIADRNGQVVPNPLFSDLDPTDDVTIVRDPSRVVLAAIVGVPWQDIARRNADGAPDPVQGLDAHGNAVGGFMTADELAAVDPLLKMSTWDLILGDPAHYVPPKDPFMIPSIDARTGQNPLTGDVVLPPGSPEENTINGREVAYPKRDDLQYACLLDLETPIDCSQDPGCACFDPNNTDPQCAEEANTPGARTLQVKASAYPGIRELAVVKGMGSQGIVTSICPEPSMGPKPAYVSAVLALGDRIRGKLNVHCLQGSLTPDAATGEVPCVLIEGRKLLEGEACDCPAPGRLAIPAEDEPERQAAKDALDPAFDCLCEIPQTTGDAVVSCQNDTRTAPTLNGQQVNGFCYVDGGASIGDPELSQDCLVKGADGDFEPGRQHRLLGAAVAKEDGARYLACRSGAAACSAK